jgi:hypothetical protein
MTPLDDVRQTKQQSPSTNARQLRWEIDSFQHRVKVFQTRLRLSKNLGLACECDAGVPGDLQFPIGEPNENNQE